MVDTISVMVSEVKLNKKIHHQIKYETYGGSNNKCYNKEHCICQHLNNNNQNIHGNTALMMAVKGENIHAVDFLLSHGANPGIKNKYGDTVFSLASESQHSGHGNMKKIIRG